MTINDSEIEAAVLAADLSPVSKTNYTARFRGLKKMFPGQPLEYFIKNPTVVYNKICSTYTSVQTRKALISAVLTMFRYNPRLKESCSRFYDMWRNYFDRTHQQGEVKFRDNKPSERQIEAHVPWDEIISKRDGLDKSSVAYLFLCMHTMIPPIRADLNEVAIFVGSKPTVSQTKSVANYMLVSDPTRQCKITLVLSEFKTSGKRTKHYEKVLPPQLCSVVRQSLIHQPRKYLFVSPRSGQPFDGKSYSNYINRLLLKIFQKPLTISTIRHSFISHLDHDKLTTGEKQDLADDMMHSPLMFDKYRLLFDDKNRESRGTEQVEYLEADQSGDGKRKKCVCVDA